MAKIAGSIWVEGNDLHYIDQFNREWYMPGIVQKAVTAKPGSIWIDPNNHYLMYVNEAGNAVMYPYPYGDRTAPLNARIGSLWVNAADNQLHWITYLDANTRHDVRAHNDVAASAIHTDSHGDVPHGDTPHQDGPHTDVPSVATHDDWHVDDPFHDHTDYWHNDFSDAASPFSDFSDRVYYSHPQLAHSDAPGNAYTVHGDLSSQGGSYHSDYWTTVGYGDPKPPINGNHDDYWNHTDIPHGDSPHIDQHGDSGHIDEPPENFHGDHNDATVHQDIPHLDAHNDGHTDVHNDAHTDTPHTDHPILIGP